jgi:CubicO group peptidase (beta-lactamase class C family)
MLLRHTVKIVTLAAITITMLAACSGKAPSLPAAPAPVKGPVTRGEYWPTKGWRSSTAKAQGMDAAKLKAALDSAQKQNLLLHGVLVIRHGYIVLEKYFAPYDQSVAHSLYSCTKSFVSALTGIAIDKKYIASVSRPVLSFFKGKSFAQVNASKRAMTVENLLTMSSGLDWSEGDDTYGRMYSSSQDWVKFVLDTPMTATPGQVFNYCSGCSHLLAAIIQKTSGMNTYDFACANLFHPLGIADPNWERDPTGIPIGGWGMSLSPRDMAKLGYLYLHKGKWDGKQVVPATWVRDSTRPQIKVDENWQYGYQWWVDPSLSFFAAIGRYGQSIFVVPGLDLVAVFTARIDSSDPETELLKKYIIPACSARPPRSVLR